MKKSIYITILLCVPSIIIAIVCAIVLFSFFISLPRYEKISYGNPPITYYVMKITVLFPEGDLAYELYSSNFKRLGSTNRLYITNGTGYETIDPKSKDTIVGFHDDFSNIIMCYRPATKELLSPDNCDNL